MVKNISVRKLRSSLSGVLKDVKNHFDRYIILKRGSPEAIIMSIEDYEGWIETLEITSDKTAMEDIKKAKEELKKGKFYKFEEVFGNNRNNKAR